VNLGLQSVHVIFGRDLGARCKNRKDKNSGLLIGDAISRLRIPYPVPNLGLSVPRLTLRETFPFFEAGLILR